MDIPNATESITAKMDTSCGEIHLTMGHVNGSPVHVIIESEFVGTCMYDHVNGIGRAISIGLQHGVALQEYISTLRGLQCEKPKKFPRSSACTGCADAISRLLESLTEEKLKETIITHIQEH